MKLIIGIGNPDKEYQNTRHNVGFMLLDYMTKKSDLGDFKLDKKSDSLIVKGRLGKSSVVLAKPQNYVNKSGEAVSKLIKNLKLKIENLAVIHDDLDIPFGNTKLSLGKNSGGHKGVESIMRAVKTKDFYRLRIGTAKRALDNARDQSDKKRDEFVRNFVLSKFSPSEQDELKKIFKEGYEKLLGIIN
ncbi:MAG: aminoacyl-tRNA hydrolase [Candidatus Yanofskybacteria bacterium RIFCSPHIGHO2_02_FULL_44_12b]|uniref:Peptidyl-tRNA hydrolase n=2 Tax=Candidatus Yanofskyibacteriota TaxID=1752733 RepID=A0A1F8GIF3_9BACT|nr:MAG: Peptidyl-tRNA hydrolase [Candidatus Yanofskybacteria bacterium GW2011_GWA2_44_9]OGN04858.1 MAG: aminoacyl-tRNA hydrolase [Candidatus Yanofskybacteria bacterium RIFCSPHIGHO2_01_FULL_44_24]OGN14068.1 MAG: aminoacyl-tRNA hydrolase [Candidatus Yanofskybacteria bacterium RIFCSPHIGHO2_02_FULL_44_12b]OGN25175.1 MAG: aminoacyl-tRNA hydrolase [Candidatus Yanofskybacteria bacterium RIFCSPLOWO2_01_FULL_44_22]